MMTAFQTGKLGMLRNTDQRDLGPDPLPGDGLPAAKRPRVEEVLQQHAPREQDLVSELMGWRNSSQESMSVQGTNAAFKGSTDFRGLFSRPPSQQPPPRPDLHRVPSAATTGLRTFADVASRPAAAPEDLGRQEVLGALRAAYNSAGPTSGSALGRSASQHAWPQACAATGTATGTGTGGLGTGGVHGTAVGPATAAVPALEDLDPEQLPVDWAIKRSVTFTSSSRFTVHDRAQQAPPGSRWRALQNVVNNDMGPTADETVQYLGCQLSWRHPEMQLDAAALAAARSANTAAAAAGGAGGGSALASATVANPSSSSSSSSGGGGLLVQRLAAWRSAFHSLYGTYRGGDCHLFYVVNLTARNPFVALFTYKGVRGSSELCAVVSQSSRVLRSRMLAAGVPFTMPLEKPSGGAAGQRVATDAGGPSKSGTEAAAVTADEEADVALCDEGPQVGPSANGAPLPGSAVADNSRESLLLLRGPRAVHGLYDFLLHDVSYPGLGGRTAGGGVLNDEVADLPLLLAPVPFDGGAVWRPSIKALTVNSKLAGADAADLASPLPPPWGGVDQDSGAVLHVLQVSGGPLPPWTTRRMCTLMTRLQPSGFSAAMETEPCSIPLNSRVVEARLSPEGEGAAAPPQVPPTFAQGGAFSLEELVAWQQPAALPGGRPMKGVTYTGGRRLSVRV